MDNMEFGLRFIDIVKHSQHKACWKGDFSEQVITGARIIDEEKTENNYSDSILYCGDENLLSDPDFSKMRCTLIYGERDKFQMLDLHPGNYIAVSDRAEYYRIIDWVMESLSEEVEMAHIAHQIQSLALGADPLNRIMTYAFELLTNPIVLVDASFSKIASAGLEGITEEPNWIYVRENSAFPSEYVAGVMRSEQNLFSEEEIGDLIYNPAGTLNYHHNAYSYRLLNNNSVIGYIKLLEYNRKFTEKQCRVLRLLSEYLPLVILNDRRSLVYNSVLEENFVWNILNETYDTPEMILSRQRSFGIRMYENLKVMTIELSGIEGKSDQLYYTIRRLKQFFRGNITVYFHGRIVILMELRESDAFNAGEQEMIVNFLEGYHYRMYISSEFHGLENVKKYYEQTEVCIKLRELLNLDHSVIRYSDVCEYHMLLLFQEQSDLSMLIHPAVRKLQKYDQTNQTDLLNTFYSYLEHQENISSTARDMFVHYNTLKYRIHKIFEVAGLTEGVSSQEAFRILLSREVLSFMRQIEQSKEKQGPKSSEKQPNKAPDNSREV